MPGFTLSAGDRQIDVVIVPPSTGGSSITGYRVQWKTSSSGSYSSSHQADITGTSYTITGLTNGTAYNVRVRASNSVGKRELLIGIDSYGEIAFWIYN